MCVCMCVRGCAVVVRCLLGGLNVMDCCQHSIAKRPVSCLGKFESNARTTSLFNRCSLRPLIASASSLSPAPEDSKLGNFADMIATAFDLLLSRTDSNCF